MKSALVQTVKENIPGALFGAVGGSVSLGLNNRTSDTDYYIVTDQIGQNDVELMELRIEGKDIDFMCVNIETIINKINEYNDCQHFYPTYFYRKKNMESKILTVKDYNRPDFPREVIMRIFLADEILEFTEGSIQKYYEKIKDGLLKIDIWDYHFTRAYGNYQNYIKDKDEVLVRKYLYTIHQLFTCDWIINCKGKPPMDFHKLLFTQKDSWIIEKAGELQRINQNATNQKEKQKIACDKDLNLYIQKQLEETLNEMKISEKCLREKRLEIEKKNGKKMSYL